MSGLSMSLVIRSVAGGSFSDEAVCWAGAGVPPRRGRAHLFTQKVPQRHIGGPAGRSAGEGLGRPAVVPPAGRGRGWMRAPARALGGGRKVGRFLRKRRGHLWTERTRSLPGGGLPRWAAKADGGPDGADVRAGGCSGSLGPRAVRGEEKGQLKWSGIRFWPMI